MTVTQSVKHPGVVRMRGRDFPVGDMCWRRAFPGLRPQARRARDFVGFLVEGSPRADDLILAAGELVANALQHTRSGCPGGLFVVEVRRWRGGVALTVIDQGGPNEPRRGTAGGPMAADLGDFDFAESGRGLFAVEMTASWWDWCGGFCGRTVTAVYDDRPRLHPVP
ncbi:ATP-binding protein [Actinomadura scrupuli]|uniref:ATP-binding protein n=1 Tax=Actinomadura scrupuli TaxID=559629 RepID=UPI003D98FBEC